MAFPAHLETVLLQPITPGRVQERDGQSYLAHWDVRAHLTRMFHFGGWSEEATSPTRLVYEDLERTVGGKQNPRPGVEVCYIAHRRLTILDPDTGVPLCWYDGSGVGVAVMGINSRGDAHDTAAKTAESDALKRCAINLGDQFGLSLYNDGSTNALVRKLVKEDDES